MQKIFKIILFVILTTTALPAQDWQEPEEIHTIYVSSISWHTGIVVPANIFSEDIWPGNQHYKDAAYLEIGWGDADYFPSRSFNPWYALKAVMWPTSSVIQINPIYGKVEAFYPNTNVAGIDISKEQMHGLREYLLGEFELSQNGTIIPVTAGPSNSYFYKGSSSYYFPKNSNVWAAKALKEAGFSINPIWYQTTGQVVKKAGQFGEMIQEKNN